MEQIITLKNLLTEQLRELCNGEHQQLYSLSNLMKKAEDIELREIIQNHIKETKQQTIRLKNIFNLLFVSSLFSFKSSSLFLSSIFAIFLFLL